MLAMKEPQIVPRKPPSSEWSLPPRPPRVPLPRQTLFVATCLICLGMAASDIESRRLSRTRALGLDFRSPTSQAFNEPAFYETAQLATGARRLESLAPLAPTARHRILNDATGGFAFREAERDTDPEARDGWKAGQPDSRDLELDAAMMPEEPGAAVLPADCELVKIPLCKGLYYPFTRMPNMFHHETQDEAGLEVRFF
ncbi:unnamed protein product [Protopolystoma xenopodis]|uniref:FZ domain-containing protein n=1 Tax=Protopolystoma xenopodis TaxID=117903 RepID=A0A3S5AE21_9PLAT|nr:unnamed protein product [Protopolystoma xenopodis]